MIGQEGVTTTDLRPSGKILVESKMYQGMSGGDYIEKDSKVTIINVDENQLVVKKT